MSAALSQAINRAIDQDSGAGAGELRADLDQARRELSQACQQLGQATAREVATRQELDDLRTSEALVEADRRALARDNEILREALAEAALHLKRAAPPRFFERELSTVQAGYLALAGDAALERVLQSAVDEEATLVDVGGEG